jgi:hypothetical protein
VNEPEIGQPSRRDIDRLVEAVLRDSGFREPPVDIAVVLEVLKLDRSFYDLQDPGFLRSLGHRIVIGTRRVVELVGRIRLQALLFFDDRKVLLDKDLPRLKHDWASAHETGHQIIPWHREFCRGDTIFALDPAWREELEAEANYAASALLFCGEAFTADARDTEPCWSSIETLKRRYRRNLHSTARRYVRHGPELPMMLLISTAWWDPKPPDQPARVRHLVLSPDFESRFLPPDPDDLRKVVDDRTLERRGGPVGEFRCQLRDKNGDMQVFRAECFYNTYYVITLLVHEGSTTDAIVTTNRATA